MTAIGAYAESLWQQVQPLNGPDPEGIARSYVAAVAHPMREIDELVRDTPEGVGWSILLDADDAPAKGLWWLAQVAGVRLRQLKSVPYRAQIANPNGEGDLATSGWVTRTTAPSATAMLNTGTPGFESTHTGASGPGLWSIIASAGFANVIPGRPGNYYGAGISIDIIDPITTAGGPFTLYVTYLDESLQPVGDEAVWTDSVDADTYPGGYGTISSAYGVAQSPSPPGTAYVGLRLDLLIAGATMHAYTNGLIVSEFSGPEADFLAESLTAQSLRLETDDEWAVYARDAIKRQGGKRRGTPDAIVSAAEDTLTGNKDARLVERVSGNAYRFELVTRPSETPDPDATLAAAAAQVPGGSKVTLTLTEGVIIDEGTKEIDAATATIDTATITDVAD